MEHYKNLDLSNIVYFCEYDLVWKTEQWKDVVGFEKLYKVSDLGRAKSLNFKQTKREQIMKQHLDEKGYCRVGLYKNKLRKKTRRLHQIVAEAFLNHLSDGTTKLIPDHKNEIKIDNTLKNIQIITNRENISKSIRNSLSKYTGVSWAQKNKKWRARITINGKEKFLGYFNDEYSAHQAYQKALLEI